jgi:hypothetical protein
MVDEGFAAGEHAFCVRESGHDLLSQLLRPAFERGLADSGDLGGLVCGGPSTSPQVALGMVG